VNSRLSKLLITGGHGQLASVLRYGSLNKKYTLIHCSKNAMDITNEESIHRAINYYQPNIIINTAAYTAVDKAENEHQLAMQINHIGAKNLAISCEHYRIPLIHFSTDYVFDGTQTFAYSENDSTNPINVYGMSKWLGEEAIRKHCQQYIILRISGLFSEYGNNFLKTILRLAKEKNELRIVTDQITCPTHANNIANVLFNLIKTLRYWGTYHYCDAQAISWYEFAVTIIEKAKKYHLLSIEKILAITSAQYPTVAKRPAYSVLNCNKIHHDYGIVQLQWYPCITRTIDRLFSQL